MRDANTIASEINELLNELVQMAGGGRTAAVAVGTREKQRHRGATGGIRFLAEDGFFDMPRSLGDVRNKLKEEGRHYGRPTVGMALLGLVRDRLLVRLKEGDSKDWNYAIRR